MNDSDEKRREERVTINKEFESFDAFINEYVTNISRTGVFIRSKTPLPVGTVVNLRFTVIMDDIESIEGTGKVVRVEDDPPGMGVVYTHLTSYSQKLIEKLMRRFVYTAGITGVMQVATLIIMTRLAS